MTGSMSTREVNKRGCIIDKTTLDKKNLSAGGFSLFGDILTG
jgi:hypothetical protein